VSSRMSKAGVSDLFDQRAKGTNFKLVGDQTTEEPKWPRSRCRRRRGRMGKWGGGVLLPSQLGDLEERRKVPQRGPPENEFWRILEAEKHT